MNSIANEQNGISLVDHIQKYAKFINRALPEKIDWLTRYEPFGAGMMALEAFLKSDCSTPGLDSHFGLDPIGLKVKHPLQLIQAAAEDRKFAHVFAYRVCELGRTCLPNAEAFWSAYHQIEADSLSEKMAFNSAK